MAARRKSTKRRAPAKSKSAPARRRPAPGGRGSAARQSPLDAKVARIQRVIQAMKDAGAVEVEMEDADGRLRIRLEEEHPPMAAYPPPGHAAAASPGPAAAEVSGAEETGETPSGAIGHVFHSPMVGSFYRAPAPDADPFVRVGDRISPDTTLCIIEAMKVMNEIKADLEGEVVEILVQNGEPVDYGQPLFVIKV